MPDRNTKAAQAAYVRGSKGRQLDVLRDCRRTELALVAEQDRCFGLIMGDYRAGVMSGSSIERRLDALSMVFRDTLDDAFTVGAHDWWHSAVGLWADAAAVDSRLMAAIALTPSANGLAESRGSNRSSAFSALLQILTPPDVREVLQIINTPVNGQTWGERLKTLTSKQVTQRGIANAVAAAYSAGGNVADVAQAVKPLVAGSTVTARRIARTESVRIANELHERSMDEAGDAVIGYTRRATLDSVTQPSHAAANGRVFKKDQDRESLPSRPNCRCWYDPILSSDVLVFGRANSLPPEVQHVEAFAGWFDQQSRTRRVAVVGEKAYARAVAKYGVQDPTWEQVTGASPTLEVDRLRGTLQERQDAAVAARRSRRKDAA